MFKTSWKKQLGIVQNKISVALSEGKISDEENVFKIIKKIKPGKIKESKIGMSVSGLKKDILQYLSFYLC